MTRHGSRTPEAVARLAREAFEQITREFEVPEHAGAILTGSLADGLGNGYSDIDIEVLDLASDSTDLGRQYGARGRQRVELFFRSSKDLATLAATIERDFAPDAAPLGKLKDYHNFCYGYPIRNRSVVEQATSAFDPDALARVSARTFAQLAARDVALGRALFALDRPREATFQLLHAAQCAASAWAAARDETYLGYEAKWLPLILGRARLPPGDYDRYMNYVRPQCLEGPVAMLASCRRLFGIFGLTDGSFDDPVTVAPAPSMLEDERTEQLTLFRANDVGDAHVLDQGTTQLWRRLVAMAATSGGIPVSEFPDRARLGALHTHGLVTVSVGTHLTAHTETQLATPRVPARMDCGGSLETSGHVTRLRVGAAQLVSCRDRLEQALVSLRSAHRLVVAAHEAAEWSVVEGGIRRAVAAACSSALASRGVNSAAPKALALLARQPEVAPAVIADGRRLSALHIQGATESTLALHALDAWLDALGLPPSRIAMPAPR